jgi:hypothetical protein
MKTEAPSPPIATCTSHSKSFSEQMLVIVNAYNYVCVIYFARVIASMDAVELAW